MLLRVETLDRPDGVVVVKLTGKLALGRESQKVESTIARLAAEGRRKIVLDMSEVNHIDSTGVGIVTFCHGQVKEAGGQFHVGGAKGSIREIFKITSVDTLVPFYDTVEAAIASFI